MIVIHRTHDIQSAQIMVSYLIANGVNARLLDASTSALIPFAVGGVRIAVDEDEAPKARALLRERGAELETY